jgi:hypothetical protein
MFAWRMRRGNSVAMLPCRSSLWVAGCNYDECVNAPKSEHGRQVCEESGSEREYKGARCMVCRPTETCRATEQSERRCGQRSSNVQRLDLHFAVLDGVAFALWSRDGETLMITASLMRVGKSMKEFVSWNSTPTCHAPECFETAVNASFLDVWSLALYQYHELTARLTACACDRIARRVSV